MSHPFCRYISIHAPSISNLSDFISDVTSNTLLLIPIEFGTVFELGVQRNIRRTRNTIFAGTRQVGARNNFAQQVIRSTYVQSDSHRILFACLLRFLHPCNRAL